MAAAGPATIEDALGALEVIHGAMGLGPDAGGEGAFVDRLYETAEILACSDWTRTELVAAARLLATSPDLDDKVRYGRPVTAADFERTRRPTETRGRDADGGERVLTTLSGFALRVRRARLFTHAEALGLWSAAGSPGTFSDSRTRAYPNAMFTLVPVEDGRALFRLK